VRPAGPFPACRPLARIALRRIAVPAVAPAADPGIPAFRAAGDRAARASPLSLGPVRPAA
jgi:hypothetical protein